MDIACGNREIRLISNIMLFIILEILNNIIMAVVGYHVKLRDSKTMKGVSMLNASVYNIGRFVLPFIQAIMPSLTVTYSSTFNIGAIFMVLVASM